MISNREVDRTRQLVRRSGVADEIEALLRPVGAGRPRALSAETFLVGLMLAARHKKSMTLTATHQVLTEDISLTAQNLLGTRTGEGSGRRAISIRQVRYVLEAFERRLAYTDDRAPGLPEDAAKAREERLQSIVDKLLDGVMPTHITHSGAYAVDETGVHSWARGKGGGASADKDARWGRKTPTGGGSAMYFGYSVTALTRIPDCGAGRDAAPILTERIIVQPAAQSVTAAALAAIDSLNSSSKTIREIVADRGFSYATPDKWASLLRQRGIEQTLDLHPLDPRITAHPDGYPIIDGVPHCPATPQDVRSFTRPPSLGAGPDLDTFTAASDKRADYALRLIKNEDDETDSSRWQCPALAGKIRCPLRPVSLGYDAATPAVTAPPTERPKCCTQSSITMKPNKTREKLRQQHYYGSVRWVAAYRRRTYVEGTFGNLKNRNTENITRGWTQVVGIVKTTLMLAVATAAANLRLLRSWAARTGDVTDPISGPDPEPGGFEEVGAGGSTQTGPPRAA